METPTPTTDTAQLSEAISAIVHRAHNLARQRCLVVAVSGIDAAGKTATATLFAKALDARSLRAALVHLDDWHTAPEVRFSVVDPGEHFYRNAYRFKELFDLLVDPLRVQRVLSLSVTLRKLPDNREFPYTYHFDDIDVLILDGLFLLKPELRCHYDYAIWIECSFETALARAVLRNQEGLSPEEIEADYRRIYFPAQEVHMRRDAPRANADLVLISDQH
jgi:uridine kinase